MQRSIGCLAVLMGLVVACGSDGSDASSGTGGGSGSGGSSGSAGSGGTASGGTGGGASGGSAGSSGSSGSGGSSGSSGSGGSSGSSGSGGSSGSTGGSGGSTPAEAITITGSGFGTKASADPVLFDDFESGALGSKIQNQPAVVGAWETGAGSEAPVYSDEQVHAGARSGKVPFTTSVYNASLAVNLQITVAYLDYWTYVVPLDSGAQGFTRNWKPFRFYGENDQLQSGITSLNGNEAAITYFDNLMSGTGFNEWTGGYPVGSWFHVQYWLRMNDLGSSNGTYRARVDGETSGESGVQLRTGNFTLSQLRIGHYWATDGVDEWPYPNSGANVYVDDVYFDTSWARVEIANAASYAAATHHEIQLVTSWTDGAVTFVPRKGSLPAGPAWAYVIGENDQVLASQAITLN